MNRACLVGVSAARERFDQPQMRRLIVWEVISPSLCPSRFLQRVAARAEFGDETRERRGRASSQALPLALQPRRVLFAAGVLGTAQKVAGPAFRGVGISAGSDVALEQGRVDVDTAFEDA